MIIHEKADLRGLAVAVIRKAVRDFETGDEETKKEVEEFFLGEWFQFWVDIGGLPFKNPEKYLKILKNRQ